MHAVRQRALEVLRQRGAGDGVLHEMVIAHEQQHNETMLQTISLLDGAKTLRGGAHPSPPAPREMEFVAVAGGTFEMGAPPGRFAYDNELPRHEVHVDTFEIARTPVTNADWLRFVSEGGYERRELWSAEGWEYVREHGMHSQPSDDDRPVMHVSAHEADAFARAHDARLPTEAEWEKAAVWDGERSLDWPWGGSGPDAVPANVHESAGTGPEPIGTRAAGASPCGALGMIGDVWEWTASEFVPYPGFRAHPYPEYSEVFFDEGGYRVLRGGSWATSARVATPTFRNWDLPQRRQIFAGLRLAR